MTEVNTKPVWAQSKREKENAARVAAGMKPKKRIMPWVVLALIVLAIAAFFLTRGEEAVVDTSVAEIKVVKQLLPNEIYPLELQTLQQTVKVTGTIAPQNQVQISSQVSGRVVDVLANAGDKVSKGQVLVNIDTRALQITLDQQLATAAATRTQLELAQSNYERARDLNSRGVGSSSSLEQALSSYDALRANLAALEASVKSAQNALDDAVIVSPIDGIVASKSVELGQTVNPGVSIYSIVDLSIMEMTGSASVATSTRVNIGQEVDVTVEGIADTTFVGKVQRINPVAVAGTRAIPVYITLDNQSNLLLGGMFATGQIVVAEVENAIAVPVASIQEDAQGDYVLKIAGDQVIRQAVEVASSWAGGRLIEITSGLSAGDVVVASALSNLDAGDTINVVEK